MHPAQEEILSFFEFRHLSGDTAIVSMQFHHLAHHIVGMPQIRDSDHGAEVTAGLRKLLEAKDCFVRASLPTDD